MRFLTTLGQFLADLSTQRLRTTLTILGITWGTVAVVVLLAFGVGFETQTRINMKGLGDGIVIMFGGSTTKSFEGFPEGRPVRLREDDVQLLQRQVAGISHISQEYTNRSTPVRRGTAVTTPVITGIAPVYGDMRFIIPEEGGRFINEIDMEQRRRVAVLGDELKKLLFGEEDAVGEQIYLGPVPFIVVGVMKSKTQNSSYGSRDQDRIFIPASAHRTIFGNRYLSNIIYKVSDPEQAGIVETQVYEVMGRRYRFDPTDRGAIGLWDTSRMLQMISVFFLGLKIFMGVVGSFTLTVGGIGVANIMFVVVRERTKEIGIKRSLGARKADILRQFFFEAGVIVLIGAILGLGVSVGLVHLVGLLPVEEVVGRPSISPSVLIATLALLALIAVLAGFFPARKAAALDPVECLRYGA